MAARGDGSRDGAASAGAGGRTPGSGGGKGRGQGKGGGQGKPGAKPGGQGKPGGKGRPAPEVDTASQLAGPLKQVLGRLPEIERRVVELRMGLTDGHPADLGDTARELGLTPHEAKQIEQRAFSRIREVVPIKHLQKFLGT